MEIGDNHPSSFLRSAIAICKIYIIICFTSRAFNELLRAIYNAIVGFYVVTTNICQLITHICLYIMYMI